MASYLDGTVTDQNGVAVAGANVYVYRSPDGLADLEDALGQPIANPVVTDADGYWKAYADDGYYTLRYYWGGRQRYVEANIVLGTPTFDLNSDPNLRADLNSSTGGSFVKFVPTLPGASATNVQNKLRGLNWSVKDAGAQGDGTTLDAAAFNLTTQASAAYTSALAYPITVPAGSYRLRASTYLRKGQTVDFGGALLNASDNDNLARFKFGMRDTGVADSGGEPVAVKNFRTLGGASGSGFFQTGIQGWSLRAGFMTSPGIAVETTSGAADGILSDIQIDQALIGFLWGSGQNITLSNINSYAANYAVSFRSGVYDMADVGGTIAYSSIIAHEFNNTASNIKGIVVTGKVFTTNVQDAGFLGYVYVAATNVEAQYNGCSFRNAYGPAVNVNTGTGHKLSFNDCVFDGARTNSAYAASTTAQALSISGGVTGRYVFQGGEIRNHPGQPVTIGGTAAITVVFIGVDFSGNTGGTEDILVTNSNASSKVILIGCRSDRTLVRNTGSAVVHGVGNVDVNGNALNFGVSALGYGVGAGGAVTQATSRTTGVTLNKTTGAITLVSAAGSTTAASFTVTNSLVAATDVILLSQKSGTDKYDLAVTAVGAGSFEITFQTKSGTTVEQPVFNFAIVKASAT